MNIDNKYDILYVIFNLVIYYIIYNLLLYYILYIIYHISWYRCKICYHNNCRCYCCYFITIIGILVLPPGDYKYGDDEPILFESILATVKQTFADTPTNHKPSAIIDIQEVEVRCSSITTHLCLF